MTTNIKGRQIDRQGAIHILIGILVFGSIWGVLGSYSGWVSAPDHIP